jgi:hypothetical protein
MRARLVAAAAALLLAAGSALGYLTLDHPAPVSAAPLLRAAASAAVGGQIGQVVHEVVVVHVRQGDGSAGNNITIDRWTQLAPNGEARIDMVSTSTSPLRHMRLVAAANGVLWLYNPTVHSVSKGTWVPGSRLYRTPTLATPNLLDFVKAVLGGPQDPFAMRDLLESAAQGREGAIRLLPPETRDGTSVDVVEVTRAPQQGSSPGLELAREVLILDLDRSSHLVRRLDLRGLNPRGSTLEEETVDFVTYQVEPTSAVPPGIFSFAPPPGVVVTGCDRPCKAASSPCATPGPCPSGKTSLKDAGTDHKNRTGRAITPRRTPS